MSWFTEQSNTVKIAIVAGVVVALIAAMVTGYNLGWVPDVVRGLVGG